MPGKHHHEEEAAAEKGQGFSEGAALFKRDISPLKVVLRQKKHLVNFDKGEDEQTFGRRHSAQRLYELLVNRLPDSGHRDNYLRLLLLEVCGKTLSGGVDYLNSRKEAAVLEGPLVDMPRGQHYYRLLPLLRVYPQPWSVCFHILYKVALGKHYPLGVAGGPGGVDDGHKIVESYPAAHLLEPISPFGVIPGGSFSNIPGGPLRSSPFQFLSARLNKVLVKHRLFTHTLREIIDRCLVDNKDAGAGLPVLPAKDLEQTVQLFNLLHYKKGGIGVLEDKLHFLGRGVRTPRDTYRSGGNLSKVEDRPFVPVIDKKTDFLFRLNAVDGQSRRRLPYLRGKLSVGMGNLTCLCFCLVRDTVRVFFRCFEGNIYYCTGQWEPPVFFWIFGQEEHYLYINCIIDSFGSIENFKTPMRTSMRTGAFNRIV